MKNINSVIEIQITTKKFIAFCFISLLLILISVSAFFIGFSNNVKFRDNHQNIVKQLENLESTYNTSVENVNSFENQLNELKTHSAELVLSLNDIRTKSDRNEQDIFFIQTIVNDKNLDSILDIFSEKISNFEADINNIKAFQKKQESQFDEIIKTFSEFKNTIINKVTSMLSSKSNSQMSSMKSEIKNKSKFNYVLSSIEYRSGVQYAVFAPKNPKKFNSLSDLIFLTVGDFIDNWRIIEIRDNSVLLNQGNMKYQVKL